jgi:general secretion pathway protein G
VKVTILTTQFRSDESRGYTLFELVITLTVLAILVMGTIPMAQNAVKRDKEVRLRQALREMRSAIDEFKRDSFGACPNGSTNSVNPTVQPQGQFPVDPRSRVVIDDCKIFDTDNMDRYPPSLDQLVEGVRVKSRSPNLQGGRGLGNDNTQATDINVDKEVTKVYLRDIPVDPMTGKAEWKLRSSYQDKDSDSWDEVNVFDVRSASNETAMNGEKYSDW